VRLEVSAFEVLAHQVKRSIRLVTDVDDARDVLGLELGERARFAAEALDLVLVRGAGQQDLDDDALIEVGVERFDEQAVGPTEDRPDAVLPGDEIPRVKLFGPEGMRRCALHRGSRFAHSGTGRGILGSRGRSSHAAPFRSACTAATCGPTSAALRGWSVTPKRRDASARPWAGREPRVRNAQGHAVEVAPSWLSAAQQVDWSCE
jgi:hypothetical protein